MTDAARGAPAPPAFVEGSLHRVVLNPRYGETDQMGVVYHARYLDWFEVGRTECFKALGLPYRRLEARGIFLPVLAVEARYHAPARYDREVEVTTRVEAFRHGFARFAYEVRDLADGCLLAEGMTKHIFVRDGRRVTLGPAELAAAAGDETRADGRTLKGGDR